jgi:DNA primase
MTEGNASRDWDGIYSVLLARDYWKEVFRGLTVHHQEGKEARTDCPACGGTKRFTIDTMAPRYFCHACGIGGSWYQYLVQYGGLTHQEAAKQLVIAAGGQWDESPGGTAPGMIQAAKRMAVLDAAMAYFIQQLEEPAGQDVKTYLTRRGYTAEDLEAMAAAGFPMGAYTSRAGVKAHLLELGYAEDDIKAAGIFTGGFGASYKLAMLWKGRSGQAEGLICRALGPLPNGEPKYKYSAGTKAGENLLGLDMVLRKPKPARGKREIILVEGAMDAPLAAAAGFPVVAIGGARLSPSQAGLLAQAGVDRVIIIPDADASAGATGAWTTIGHLQAAIPAISIMIATPPEGCKDADDTMRTRGKAGFQTMLNGAVPVAKALPGLGWKYWLADKGGAVDTAWDELELETAKLWAEMKAEDRYHLQEGLQALRPDFPLEGWQALGRDHAGQATERDKDARMDALLKQLQEMGERGAPVEDQAKAMKAFLLQLRVMQGLTAPGPYSITELKQDLDKWGDDGFMTGFKELDDKGIRIPSGAITLVGARPSHGKTTFLMNLMLNMADFRPSRRFYFFSYEEAAHDIATKLIMAMAGVNLGKTNLHAYRAAIRGFGYTEVPEDRKKVQAAIQDYQAMAEAGRVVISDTPYIADDLASLIEEISSQPQGVGAIFVDYAQKVQLRGDARTPSRQVELQRALEMLRQAAVKAQVPLVMGAQMNRASAGKPGARPAMHEFREAGDLEQDANLALGLVNPAMAGEDEILPPSVKDRLIVNVMKNRGGPRPREEITLEYMPACFKVGGGK